MPDFKLIERNIGTELLSHCSTCWGQCVPQAVCPAQTAALPGKGWWDAGTPPAVLGPHQLPCWDHIASAQLACKKKLTLCWSLWTFSLPTGESSFSCLPMFCTTLGKYSMLEGPWLGLRLALPLHCAPGSWRSSLCYSSLGILIFP